MKKIALLLLLSTMLSTALTTITACSSDESSTVETTQGSDSVTTTLPSYTDLTPSGSTTLEHNVKLNEDMDTMKVAVEASQPTTEEHEGYSLVTAGNEWKTLANVDYSLYDYLGNGGTLIENLKDEEKNRTYASYIKSNRVNYFKVTYNDGTPNYKKVSQNTVAQTKALGAKLVIDRKLNRLIIYFQPITLRAAWDYSSMTGKIGTFVNVSFHTSAPITFTVSVTKENKSTSSGYIHHKHLVPKLAEDGSFVGTAKFTLPYTAEPGEYYINIIADGSCLQSIPLTLEEGSDPRSDKYHLMLAGDWDYITSASYMQNMIDQFYNTYPRLMARWGTGTEPTNITFHADSTYDGVAYASGQEIVVSTDYASQNPKDLGYFSHEMTHSVQQYNFNYGDNAWWTENLASYGRFRYFEWTDANYIKLYDKNDSSLYFWPNKDGTTWHPYGNGCLWFFAYMDYHWPTTQGPNGERINGLIDIINFEIKLGKLKGGSDDPYNASNTFNKIVKEVTGYDTVEDIRKQYEADFKSGAWDFKGFADYEGNFMTENLPGVPNPQYPMVTDKNPGDKTATLLTTPVTEGTNLALGATVYKVSGQQSSKEAGSMLVDGDLTTKWCCSASKVTDKTYSLDGTQQWIILDLGEAKTFNTYTIYNTKTQETHANASEWEILISNDAENWVSADYQPSCGSENICSFNIGTQTARYILIKGYTVDKNIGTVRLYEFQLYNVQ